MLSGRLEPVAALAEHRALRRALRASPRRGGRAPARGGDGGAARQHEPHGYELSRDVMKLNRFLGDLVGGPAVMGEWSYIFCLFGTPSATEPWGWQFFGHHLVLNCFVLGEQMVLTPAFWGAEPSYADHGPFKGIRIFPGRGARRAEADALVLGRAAEARHRRAFDDGRRPAGRPAAFRRQPASRRRVPGQPHRALRGTEGRASCRRCSGAT